MKVNLHRAYTNLGLKPGANVQEIKRAHREIVKNIHPDIIQDPKEKEIATQKISQINASYNYLIKIKHSVNKNRKTTVSKKKSSYQTTSTKKTSHQTYSTDTKKQAFNRTKKATNKKKEPEFIYQASPIDRILTTFSQFYLNRQLSANRRRREVEFQKRIHDERKYWKKLKQKYDERTRIGLYRSLINAVIFGRIIYFQKTSKSTGLGTFNMKEKYQIDIAHSLIRDKIFYAVNKGFNLFLKYAVTFVASIQMILFVLLYHGYHLIPSLETFILFEAGAFAEVFIVFAPDNFFQRFILWKHRNLNVHEIPRLFKKNRLPAQDQFHKNIMVLVKSVILFVYVPWFYQYSLTMIRSF